MKEEIEHIDHEHELHDSVLSAITFNFEQNSATIFFEFWDSVKKDYTDFRMIFSGLYKFSSHFSPEGFFLPGDGECQGWTWAEVRPSCFEAVFTFFSRSTYWTVTLGFTSLRTEGGLSEEAREARYAYIREQTGEID